MKIFFNSFSKGMLTLLMVAALLCAGTVTASAAGIDRDVEQLKSIVQDLIIQRDADNPLGTESRLLENLHLHSGFLDVITGSNEAAGIMRSGISLDALMYDDVIAMGYDPRFALLGELRDIMWEASALQNRMMGVDAPNSILSTWSGPTPLQSGFSVSFVCDNYLPFVEIVLDFVGIPEYMLEVGPSGRVIFFGSPPTVTEHEEYIRTDDVRYNNYYEFEPLEPAVNKISPKWRKSGSFQRFCDNNACWRHARGCKIAERFRFCVNSV